MNIGRLLIFILTLTIIGICIVYAYPLGKKIYNSFQQHSELQEKTEQLLASEAKPSEEHRNILNRLIQLNISANKGSKAGVKNLLSLDHNGKWSDIDFSDNGEANWKPLKHLERIKAIAIGYRDSTSEIYHDQKAINAIENGLKVWLEKNPICKNWWFNDIAAPKTLVSILALVDTEISSEIKYGVLALLETRPLRKNTPAFKVHSYYPHIIRGCILGNDSIVYEAVNKFFMPLCTDGPEDIQADMSYLKHGAQFHNGSYGGEFIERYVDMIWILKGSKYEPSQDKIDLLCQFFREGYMPLFRGKYIDYSSTGRAITRKNYLNRSNSLQYIDRLIDIDSLHRHQYEELFSTPIAQTKNIDFSTSGFMLHKRPAFDFSVRCVSKNLAHTESMNGENLYGTYLSDGAINIRTEGDEYYNIFPVWEWDYIPGTTTSKGELPNPHDSKDLGEKCNTATISDGKYGIMCYQLADYGISANKAWFMLDDAIVCLGNGITGNTDIHTAVNQCVLDGEVYIEGYNLDDNETLACDFKGWIWHDNIGYYFPRNQNIRLKSGFQTGSWKKINKSQPVDSISMPVFNLSIEHGNNPENASYEYFIVPGLSNKNSLKQFDTTSIDVIANDQNKSAIYDSKSDILGIVFWKAGSFDYNSDSITKDIPCIVMVSGYKIRDGRRRLVQKLK